MGTGTYSESSHHHHKNLNNQRNGNPAASSSSTNKTFLPILCRVSVKDTIIAHHPKTICPKKDDPSSPRVSCMGQVKHHHHHHLTPSSTIKHHHRIISEKPRKSTNCNQAMLIHDQRRRRPLCTKFVPHNNNNNNVHDNNSYGAVVVPVLNMAELDPPLPVIKRLPQSCLHSQPVSLWKRRSRGDGLANIQIPSFQCTYSVRTSLQLRPST